MGIVCQQSIPTITCLGGINEYKKVFVLTDIVCGDPGPLDNAAKYGTSYMLGDTVYYTCDEGYERTSEQAGSIQLVCGPDIVWYGQDSCKGKNYLINIMNKLNLQNSF